MRVARKRRLLPSVLLFAFGAAADAATNQVIVNQRRVRRTSAREFRAVAGVVVFNRGWRVGNQLRNLLLAPALALALNACSSRDATSNDIGPSGGSVAAAPGDGPKFSLDVPIGAVAETLKFSLRPIKGRLPGAVGPAVEALPHGAVFSVPVALRFTPRSEEIAPGIAFSELRVATLIDGRWELLPTSYAEPGVIQGLTTHFSTFALVAPCHASGTDVDFPLTGCPTFSPRIQTSAPVTLEAIAETLTLMMQVRAMPGQPPVTATISGLTPGWTYYLLRDVGSGELPLTASSTGELSFSQDVATNSASMLMVRKGSMTLSAATCSSVGTWNAATKTCTLTQDYLSPPIFIDENGLTLDCKDVVTGLRHVVGNVADAGSSGIFVSSRSGVKIRNCNIINVDFGVVAQSAPNLSVDGVTVDTSGTDGGGVAFMIGGSIDAGLTDIVAQSVRYGVMSSFSDNLSVRKAKLTTLFDVFRLSSESGVLLEDVTIDGRLSLPPPPGFTERPAVELSLGSGTIRRLAVTQMHRFFSAVLADNGSQVAVEDSQLNDGQRGAALYGPLVSRISGSTITNNDLGLLLVGNHLVYHNNIHGNALPNAIPTLSLLQVLATNPLELSDFRPASLMFGEGNYWGRTCPAALFVAGTDSNAANVVDSHPFARANGWAVGDAPDCPTIATPTLSFPTNGALLTTATPAFRGIALPGATVELVENSIVLGSAVSTVTGTFVFIPTVPLAEGAHLVAARARLNGASSFGSPQVAFTIDTVAPPVPTLTSPSNGSSLTGSAVIVSGTAEAGVTVIIKEGLAAVGSIGAQADGLYLLAIEFTSGTHTIVVVAADAAGNRSAASPPRSFSVTVPSAAAPLLSSGGGFQLTLLRDSPNPFNPSLGEFNTVHIEGKVLHAPGINGNHVWQAGVRRTISQPSTGIVFLTVDAVAPVLQLPGTNNFVFTLDNVWDGRNQLGGLALPGLYDSTLKVWFIRDPMGPPGGIPIPPFGPCGPVAQPVDGDCKFEQLEFLHFTVGLIDRPPFIPPPIIECIKRRESCNGLDDNCNGLIDEGGVCDVSCAPLN